MIVFAFIVGVTLIVLSVLLPRRQRPPTTIVVTTLQPEETKVMTDDELELFRPKSLDSATWIKALRTRERKAA